MAEVFLDTSFAIALSSASDQFHQRAVALAEEFESNSTRFVTTRAVLLEIGNALARLRHRQGAVALLRAIESDPRIEIVALSETLFARAFELFQQRTDKEWGLIDCVSCVVMTERGLSEVLTADDHFRQMGFHVLLSLP